MTHIKLVRDKLVDHVKYTGYSPKAIYMSVEFYREFIFQLQESLTYVSIPPNPKESFMGIPLYVVVSYDHPDFIVY